LYTDPQYSACHLLFYTGITRTAKQILAEIVKNMFLFDSGTLSLLQEMKEHTMELYNAVLHNDFEQLGRLVGTSWAQNKALDRGTNPEAVERIIREIDDLCFGYKLPGAGGGGYLYMIAKDPQAAALIRQRLTELHINDKARFVDMRLSRTGLQVSRS
ncbi:MAG: bifunctional fucokinase/L-fucose-1-P-guanylyltransferase, partial [Bacteroidaceae bacterium]|nr:bifunctional fucokinase/L-fucose-1-P-guanylyltransferase [Bacteroidaceae bacterium]